MMGTITHTHCIICAPCAKFHTWHMVFEGNSCAITRNSAYDCMVGIVCSTRHKIELKQLCATLRTIAHVFSMWIVCNGLLYL